MKIHSVYDKKLNELYQDESIEGIFLTGSLARGTETEYSDLDIIVLYPENKLIEEQIEGVPIETHYNTFDSIVDRFKWDSGSLYLYAYGKIVSDKSGRLLELVKLAKEGLASFKVDEDKKQHIAHKMQALKEKLTASLSLCDELKTKYLIHNNFKNIVEYIFMQNNLPVPPQGLLYEIYDTLPKKPCERWLERLITLKGNQQAKLVLENIICD